MSNPNQNPNPGQSQKTPNQSDAGGQERGGQQGQPDPNRKNNPQNDDADARRGGGSNDNAAKDTGDQGSKSDRNR